MRRPYWIPKNASPYDFPNVDNALDTPDGLLAIGGDLSPSRLMVAYHRGIFPWYSDEQPILWWSPSQRMVLFPNELKTARSLRKTLRKQLFTVTIDQAFHEVMQACAEPRSHQQGTWITTDMIEAYCQLHEYDFAHSIEAWYGNQLVGGLYGVTVGKLFFGESMFSRMTDASKVAFTQLVWQLQRWGYELIDCQVYTNHLDSLGAREIPRKQFCMLLDRLSEMPAYIGNWEFDDDLVTTMLATKS
ncbi:leucyl/phenylalanyl-tRNA--protein transferase [Beggiatoa leptomitoformis]|uniref:Leucyl/phenylalanyl-tRNA--protein transferase n=1 Tax=Beggiatoa leptomitoformis TaxID=288004 RepID=A0A2N9YH64_9GAMM|nr:leucyl/phenylalanyl-tRNA--protein transferase [Beggiatoa leptomitoformis]ALG67841.1 leucyl/phenylalanyl-tRNA--protein transferase [Beggiatoa leptomitoformis]AUI69901.1 leucyl/phenylalanyl-tRNA--protein transferase [Beggiatoa leptomitoformis]